MTERLYYADAHLRSFTAKVVAMADDRRRAYLDRSAFYPTSGGQPHDVGMLDGVPVIDVVDEEARVAHLLERPLERDAGDVVHGEIDWRRRYDLMQQHTAQHLLSAVLDDSLRLRTVSVHFGAETSTVDVAPVEGDAAVLEPDRLTSIEARANEIVAEARPVTVSFEDASTATGLRKPSDRAGELRIVTIAGIDRSACGGTHVRTTAELGPIFLRRQERVRQGLRIEFTSGGRSLDRARRDLVQLSRIARAYSAPIDETASLVEAQAAQLRDLEAAHRRALEDLAGYRARDRHDAALPDAGGVRRILERVAVGGADTARSLALAVCALPSAVFIAASHAPPSVLVATSADSGLDAGKLLRPLLERVGGRGGGSPRLAQGSAPSPEAIDQVVQWLTSPASDLAESVPNG
jgi:alanyl-tRNA synthetase